MKKFLIALALVVAFAAPVAAHAGEEDKGFSTSITPLPRVGPEVEAVAVASTL